MCLRMQPVSAGPDARQTHVHFVKDQKHRRRSLVWSELLEDETIHGPDLVLAVFIAARLRIRVAVVLMRVR